MWMMIFRSPKPAVPVFVFRVLFVVDIHTVLEETFLLSGLRVDTRVDPERGGDVHQTLTVPVLDDGNIVESRRLVKKRSRVRGTVVCDGEQDSPEGAVGERDHIRSRTCDR